MAKEIKNSWWLKVTRSSVLQEYLEDENVVKVVLTSLLKYGFCVVDGVLDQEGKATIDITEKLVYNTSVTITLACSS